VLSIIRVLLVHGGRRMFFINIMVMYGREFILFAAG
jgi:hypothetical protein